VETLVGQQLKKIVSVVNETGTRSNSRTACAGRIWRLEYWKVLSIRVVVSKVLNLAPPSLPLTRPASPCWRTPRAPG
jgi:hypothetical protein